MYHNYAVANAAEMDEEVAYLRKNSVYRDSDIALMPDAHKGKAHASVGFTATYTDRIVPNTIGVDLNCRVSLVPLGINLEELDLAEFDEVVKECVPSGFSLRETEHAFSKSFPYENLCCWNDIKEKEQRFRLSMGTMGGNNHCIEVDRDKNGRLWLLVHTGTRNLGLQVANYYQQLAVSRKEERIAHERDIYRERVSRYHDLGQFSRIGEAQRDFQYYQQLECEDELAYLEGADMGDYIHDATMLRMWSLFNHQVIINEVRDGLRQRGSRFHYYDDGFSVVHNYIDEEAHIIRKGAISARAGEVGIIPLNMRDGVLLVRGKGNPDWNCSLPHGAGRILSRRQAREQLSMDAYKSGMEGIYTSSIAESTLDEWAEAYKSADAIIEAIGDNAEVIDHMLPVYNFKAKD